MQGVVSCPKVNYTYTSLSLIIQASFRTRELFLALRFPVLELRIHLPFLSHSYTLSLSLGGFLCMFKSFTFSLNLFSCLLSCIFF